MLTFILLVVLGGGVGLLVVSLAESGKPTADAPSAPRAAPDTDPPPGRPIAPQAVSHVPQNEGVAPEVVAPEPAPAAWELVPVGGPAEQEPAPPRRRRTGEGVPRSQVALEGRFADVAQVSVWRRFLAVVGILAISVLGGVFVAAVLAAAIGAAAELLNQAIG